MNHSTHRKEQVEKAANTPSPNPRYKGLTPKEVAQVLFKPLSKSELQALKRQSKRK